MNPAQREEMARQKAQAKLDYEKSPAICGRPGCGQPIPFFRYLKGGKFCCQYCSILVRAEANRHPWRTFPTVDWNGRVKKLEP